MKNLKLFLDKCTYVQNMHIISGIQKSAVKISLLWAKEPLKNFQTAEPHDQICTIECPLGEGGKRLEAKSSAIGFS